MESQLESQPKLSLIHPDNEAIANVGVNNIVLERPVLQRQVANVWPASDCVFNSIEMPNNEIEPSAPRPSIKFPNFNLEFHEIKKWIDEKANTEELSLLYELIARKISKTNNIETEII